MLQLTLDSVPFFAVLLYIPFVCISDWRTRRFNPLWFIPLICVCVPFLYEYLSTSPTRNFVLMGVTIFLCLIWLGLALIRAIGGGDFLFASLLMIFIQDYPFVVPRTWFPLDFFLITWLCACALPIVAYANNFEHRKEYSLKWMLTHYPGGFPYMIVISIAFLITAAVGVLV